MADFQWKTEDKNVWDDDPITVALPVPRRRRRLIILLLLLLVLLLVAAYRHLDQRLAGVASDVEVDVLNNHALVAQAAVEGDVELFASLLSGRDQQWATVQQELLHQQALFDRSALGLQWLPGAETEPEVALSPDLQTAEVVSRRPYSAQVGNGISSTVWLQQTALYRQGTDRWLYAPPDNAYDFWGDWQKVEGRYLSLSYRERDRQLAQRLAADLEVRLGEMWRLIGVEAVPLYVRLDSNPEALLGLVEPAAMLTPGQDVTLPSPSLVGIPADEAAYRALLRGYAAQLVARALLTLSGYQCCEHQLFYRALVDWVLADLRLQPAPLAAAGFTQVQAASLPLSALQSMSAVSGERDVGTSERQAVYSFAAFLVHSGSLATILQNPSLAPETVAAWFPNQTLEEVQQAWWKFLAEAGV